MVCIVDSSSGLGLTWNISHHAGVHIVAVLWLALSLVGGGELDGVILAAYANRQQRKDTPSVSLIIAACRGLAW